MMRQPPGTAGFYVLPAIFFLVVFLVYPALHTLFLSLFDRDSSSFVGLRRSFLNSLMISVPSTVFTLWVAALAAYAFAWMRFPGRDALFTMVVGLLVIPLQMTLIPVLKLLTALHLTGTFPAVWLAHTAYGLPFAIFLLRNFFITLPRDLFESASLDGASHLILIRFQDDTNYAIL